LCVAAFFAANVVCGGGRRHGGRLGFGCIVQRVRVLEVLVAFVSFLCLWVLVPLSGRGVILAPFPPFHPCGRQHGGRLGLGCILQPVRCLEVLVAFCVFSGLVGVGFFLWPWRHIGAFSSVSSLSGFSRGDWFWLLPRFSVRCGVGAWCVAAGGGTAGVLVLVASCSVCVS
jgi:hypothetical protein